MNTRTWLGATTALALLMTIGAGGCGQEVATCTTVCALPDNPGNGCVSACTASEAACTTTACSADFQAYLTCLGNAGTYSAVDGLCAGLAKAVGAETTGLPPVDGGLPDGDVTPDSTTGSCSTATCTSVCATETAAGDCAAGCETTASECAAESVAFQALLTCICEAGGLVAQGALTAECSAVAQDLAATCPSITGIGMGGSGGGTIVVDASTLPHP